MKICKHVDGWNIQLIGYNMKPVSFYIDIVYQLNLF
ncbi:hypothetical protein P378_10455 [Desulforamulus profundi]|uniref:Uncharacterized protein n=1 Tax=Desulforamulus profundi TaxID=1383067 RepID=A0A2C6MF27_9FIRM|nr:hypothetical protein P378_10455 [Desulforamulus profundi]